MAKIRFSAKKIDEFSFVQSSSKKNNQTIFWDAAAPGLGLRVTKAGVKSYIFETRLNGKTLRISIGDIRTWTIGRAQAEATRLKSMTDQGYDPRQVMARHREEEQADREAKEKIKEQEKVRQARDAVTLDNVWTDYIAERRHLWSELHYRDHLQIMQKGGEKRARSKKLTEAGPLASLANERLVDINMARIEVWAKEEALKRPTRARLALRLLKACLFWCAAHTTYAGINDINAAQSKKARESLGKSKVKNDVIQREQLAAWFSGVREIGNPVISAYLQSLLLTGARREELATLKWDDVDFQWGSLKLNDKVEDSRMVPLTPYVAQLLRALPRVNEWVFSSATAASGHLTEPSIAHRKACANAGLDVSLHGLRRSFASLCEWIETPSGIAAQIQGHAPQGVREQNYIRRPLDLLRMWHVKIESWILEQAQASFRTVIL
jgi:integrase